MGGGGCKSLRAVIVLITCEGEHEEDFLVGHFLLIRNDSVTLDTQGMVCLDYVICFIFISTTT